MNSKFFILYKYGLEEEIQWPEGWGWTCRGNLAPMLQEVLKTKAVASEIKLIWNYEHRRYILKDENITEEQLDGYLAAKTGSLHFQSKGTRDKAVKALTAMGATGLAAVDTYRDVLIYQAHYHQHKKFPVQK